MNIYAMKKPKRINSVSVTVFLAACVIGYIGWFALPIFWPMFQVKGIMRTICQEAYRETQNEELMKRLLVEIKRTGLPLTKDNFRLTRIMYTPQELSDRKIKSDSWPARRGKKCTLEMYYEDDFLWPIFGTSTRMVFDPQVESSLEQVEY